MRGNTEGSRLRCIAARDLFLIARQRLNSHGGPVGGQLQQLDILGGELAIRDGANVHDADHPAARTSGTPIRDRIPLASNVGFSTVA